MATDLIERLRNHPHIAQRDGLASIIDTCGEAATLLERQAVLLAEAREALRVFGGAADIAERIVGHDGPLDPIIPLSACLRARSVLRSLEAEG